MRQFACLLNLVIIRNAPWKVHVRSVRSLLADLEAPAPVSGVRNSVLFVRALPKN